MEKLTTEIINENLKNAGNGIRLIDDFINSKTKILFECNCGNKWKTLYHNAIRSKACPKCSVVVNSSKQRFTKETINSTLISSGRSIRQTGDYINARTVTNFECALGHYWRATPDNILRGNGCPECSTKIRTDKLKWTKKEINELIMDRGITLLGDYTTSKTKTDFGCDNGHVWRTTPDSIIRRSGCPSCADYGFKPGKRAWIYILVFSDYIKYGITNNLNDRLNKHKRNGDYTVALTKLYEDGGIAYNWEKNIKIIFGGRFVSKEIMPDGYTETLPLDKLQSLLDTII